MRKLILYYFKKDLFQTSILCTFVIGCFFILSTGNFMLDSFFGLEGYIGLGIFISCITVISTKVDSFSRDFTTNREFMLQVPVERAKLAVSHMIVILIFAILTGPFILYAALYTFKGDVITGFFSIFSLGWWGLLNMMNLVIMLSTVIFIFILMRFFLMRIDKNTKRVSFLLLVSHITFFLILFWGISKFMPLLLSHPVIVFCVTIFVLPLWVSSYFKSLKITLS